MLSPILPPVFPVMGYRGVHKAVLPAAGTDFECF